MKSVRTLVVDRPFNEKVLPRQISKSEKVSNKCTVHGQLGLNRNNINSLFFFRANNV